MADLVYGVDRIYAPVSVKSGENVFFVRYIVTTYEITITPRDDYYVHLDASKDGQYGYSLLKEIEGRINDAIPGDVGFSISWGNNSFLPADGTKNVSLTFDWDTSEFFQFAFSEAGTTFDIRFLGYPLSLLGVVDVGLNSAFTSFRKPPGFWQSWNIADNAASSKTYNRIQNIAFSSEDVERSARKKYLDKKFRTITYNWVPAVHIFSNRSEDPASRETGQALDGNNALERLWFLATAGDGDDRLVKCIIHHDAADAGTAIFGGRYEIARLSNLSQVTDFSEIITQQRMAGEYYQVSMDWDIIEGTYDQ